MTRIILAIAFLLLAANMFFEAFQLHQNNDSLWKILVSSALSHLVAVSMILKYYPKNQS